MDAGASANTGEILSSVVERGGIFWHRRTREEGSAAAESSSIGIGTVG